MWKILMLLKILCYVNPDNTPIFILQFPCGQWEPLLWWSWFWWRASSSVFSKNALGKRKSQRKWGRGRQVAAERQRKVKERLEKRYMASSHLLLHSLTWSRSSWWLIQCIDVFFIFQEGEVKKEGEEEEKEQEKLGKLEFSLDYNFTDSQVGPVWKQKHSY